MISLQQYVVAEIKKLCFEFIWNGKDRIKRVICYQDYGEGGLRMIDFELSVKTQRLMWLKRLLYEEMNMGWKLYFDHIFRMVGGRFVSLCNYDMKLLAIKAPMFYLEMLKAWQDMESCRNFQEGKTNPIICNNNKYLHKNKMIFVEDLYKKNIYL